MGLTSIALPRFAPMRRKSSTCLAPMTKLRSQPAALPRSRLLTKRLPPRKTSPQAVRLGSHSFAATRLIRHHPISFSRASRVKSRPKTSPPFSTSNLPVIKEQSQASDANPVRGFLLSGIQKADRGAPI